MSVGDILYLVSPILGLSMAAKKYFEISEWRVTQHCASEDAGDMLAVSPYGDGMAFPYDQPVLAFKHVEEAIDAIQSLHMQ